MNQNLGGVATGSWDSETGEFTDLTWSATLTQGMQAGAIVTWTLQGKVLSKSPTATSNFAASTGTLEIPSVDVYDAEGNMSTYNVSLKLVPSDSGKILFELTGSSPK